MYFEGLYEQPENGSSQFVLGRKKIILVGAGRCGKTSLILSYLGRILPTGNQRVPDAEYDGIISFLDIPDLPIMLCDVPMQDQQSLRHNASYLDSDVVFLCYAIDDPESFIEAIIRWLPEIRFLLAVPIILVGLKSDLRSPDGITTHDGRTAISLGRGSIVKTNYNLSYFVECSAYTGDGIVELFTFTRFLFSV